MQTLTRAHWSAIGIGVGSALVGLLLFFGARHLYADHQDLHALKAWVIQVQQAQKAQQAKPAQ
jgi:hypothetical protein